MTIASPAIGSGPVMRIFQASAATAATATAIIHRRTVIRGSLMAGVPGSRRGWVGRDGEPGAGGRSLILLSQAAMVVIQPPVLLGPRRVLRVLRAVEVPQP